MQLHRYFKLALTTLVLAASTAQAAYNLRYTTIAPGAVTFTGNTIGLNKASGSNNPGTSQAIGAYIAEGQGAATYSGHPAPTTSNWLLNRSTATLNIPAGATVLYAELIWGGSYSYGTQFRTLAERNGNVDLITPLGTTSVASDTLTRSDLGTIGGSGGTCSSTTPCFYVRSANVTTIVQALGTGVMPISVGKIPATIGASENNLNTGGWTLAVAYRDVSKAEHKMNIYVGSEFVTSGLPATAQVTNFCTAPSGAQSGRLMASAMEGDPNIAGDNFLFGATNPPPGANRLSGPRNLTTNFFAGQITKDDGTLDTTGSFGSLNSSAGASVSGARQGWDVVNVSLDAFLLANQTNAYAQATSTGDTYLVNALGIEIKVGQPSFPTSVKTVDKTVASVGEELLYTITLDNTTGTAQATNVRFFDVIPPGTSFVAGSFTQAGVPVPAANPTNPAGVALPNIPTASALVVTFKVRVDTVPASPAAASYVNSARWTYDYIPCAGQPTVNGEKITNPVTTTIARMSAVKTVAPAAGAQAAGATLTYTIAMTNDGLANSSGSTMADAIPANTTYVAGSTTLNGVAVADLAGGVMPFATAAAVNSSGQAAGVIAFGATATVAFQVTINNNATGTITNSAVADIDGPAAGSQPPVTPPPTTTTLQPPANVSVTKSNAVSSVVSGTTTTYTLTVSNAGPGAANNTVVQDPVATGLACTSVTCTGTTGGAVCPATLTIPALQGAGLVVPTLPSASSVTLQVACNVTATGV